MQKFKLKTKFRMVIFLIVILAGVSVISFIGLRRTNSFLKLERRHVVITMKLKLSLIQYSQTKDRKFLDDYKDYNPKEQDTKWYMGLLPGIKKMEKIADEGMEIMDPSFIGYFEAWIFKILFSDEVITVRTRIIEEKNILKEFQTLIQKHLQAKITYQDFSKKADQLINKLFDFSHELELLSDSIRTTVTVSLLVLSIIMSIVTLTLVYILLLYVQKNINKFTAAMTDISKGEGDLSVELPSHSVDTFGILGRSFNLFLKAIRKLIIDVKENVLYVRESSHSIVDFSEHSYRDVNSIINKIHEINKSAEAQSSNVIETMDVISEMVGLMKNVAVSIDKQTSSISTTSYTVKYMLGQFKTITANSEKVDSSANELLMVAKKGGDMVSQALESIRDIQNDSSKIREIVDVISSIAEKTNLLAMNAAIEAAHAGKYGKGFAVVADEVRKLAESSSSASKEIIELIKNTVTKIEGSARLSTRSYEALNTILENTDVTVQFINEITTGMKELMTEANEILNFITELTGLTSKVGENAEDSKVKGETVLVAVQKIKEYASSITTSLQEQTKHSESILRNVESLSDYSKINEKIVLHLKDLSDRFKTDIIQNEQNQPKENTTNNITLA